MGRRGDPSDRRSGPRVHVDPRRECRNHCLWRDERTRHVIDSSVEREGVEERGGGGVEAGGVGGAGAGGDACCAALAAAPEGSRMGKHEPSEGALRSGVTSAPSAALVATGGDVTARTAGAMALCGSFVRRSDPLDASCMAASSPGAAAEDGFAQSPQVKQVPTRTRTRRATSDRKTHRRSEDTCSEEGRICRAEVPDRCNHPTAQARHLAWSRSVFSTSGTRGCRVPPGEWWVATATVDAVDATLQTICRNMEGGRPLGSSATVRRRLARTTAVATALTAAATSTADDDGIAASERAARQSSATADAARGGLAPLPPLLLPTSKALKSVVIRCEAHTLRI